MLHTLLAAELLELRKLSRDGALRSGGLSSVSSGAEPAVPAAEYGNDTLERRVGIGWVPSA